MHDELTEELAHVVKEKLDTYLRGQSVLVQK